MIIRIILRSEAETDLTNTYLWYEEQRQGLGKDFIHSADNSLALIKRHRFAFPQIHRNIRRVLLRRFPYGIFYVLHDNQIVVLAVFHFKRDLTTLLRTLSQNLP